jgi:aconitase B
MMIGFNIIFLSSLGMSFPAESGLVAFAAATGIMSLDMPESVLVKFSGTMQPGMSMMMISMMMMIVMMMV